MTFAVFNNHKEKDKELLLHLNKGAGFILRTSGAEQASGKSNALI